MDLGLKGKAALVTGGSRGIGKEIARSLAREGANVAICARDEQTAKATAEELSKETGSKVLAFKADTGNADDVKMLVADTVAALGGLDILVNNAARIGGTGGPDSFAALNEEMIHGDFNVKILGYLRVAHEAAPHMEKKGWGRIINIDGMGARNAGGISGGLRNAAVANFSKSMSEELGPKGITVNVVHPSTTATSGWEDRVGAVAKRQDLPMEKAEETMGSTNAIRRLVRAEEVGNVVTFLCSEQAACVTGESLAAAGGASKAVTY
ncbi:MAG: SDR family oxidoreductase [Dehalococcoidia bacterium]